MFLKQSDQSEEWLVANFGVGGFLWIDGNHGSTCPDPSQSQAVPRWSIPFIGLPSKLLTRRYLHEMGKRYIEILRIRLRMLYYYV